MSANERPIKSRTISDAIREVLEHGATATLVTLLETAQALSIDVGAKLLVRTDGTQVGSFGDPSLEAAIIQHVAAFSRTREEARIFKVAEFAPDLTQFGDLLILFERLEAEPRLVIAGAGHVGASLARLAALVGYRVTLIDDRAEFVTRELFSSPKEQNIDPVLADSWSEAMRAAIGNGRGVSIAIVTRGHKQDEDCLRATIAAIPDYVGMIGSKRRTNIVLDKLREEGADESELEKVRAPIGLDIGAVSPEEVALAILAEIIAERRGGPGLPLSSWRRS